MNEGDIGDNRPAIAGHFFKASEDGRVAEDEYGQWTFFQALHELFINLMAKDVQECIFQVFRRL